MTASALKKIGYIGPVPECSTGNKNQFSTLRHPEIFKLYKIHNSYSPLFSFDIYTYYDAVANLFSQWLHYAFVGKRFFICRYLPRSVGMRRIALHKSVSAKGDKMYLLVCECADLLKDISAAAVLIPALRARLCGYTGLYRPIQAF